MTHDELIERSIEITVRRLKRGEDTNITPEQCIGDIFEYHGGAYGDPGNVLKYRMTPEAAAEVQRRLELQ